MTQKSSRTQAALINHFEDTPQGPSPGGSFQSLESKVTADRGSGIRSFRSARALAISKTYLLTCRDGSKKNIKRQDRDSLLARGRIKQIAPCAYLETSLVVVSSGKLTATSSTLQALAVATKTPTERPEILPGSFIVETADGRRLSESLENAAALIVRLRDEGKMPCEAAA